MTDPTYAITEIVGTSTEGVDGAIENALTTARRTLRNLSWFEVSSIRGSIAAEGDIDHYQVTVKLGFRYDS